MIPKFLHQIWVGSEPPGWVRDMNATWQSVYPDWDYILWTDPDDLPDWENRDLVENAERYVPADAVGQFKSDLMRYEILFRFGGFYTDCDTEALRPYDFSQHSEFAVLETKRWVGNTYLASVPRSPSITKIVSGVRESVLRKTKRSPSRPTVLTGPQYITDLWHGHRAPTSQWFPYSFSDVDKFTIPSEYGDAYAVHHWQHRRTKRGISL